MARQKRNYGKACIGALQVLAPGSEGYALQRLLSGVSLHLTPGRQWFPAVFDGMTGCPSESSVRNLLPPTASLPPW